MIKRARSAAASSKSKAKAAGNPKPKSLADAVRAALQRAAGAGPPDESASKLDHVADALVTKACAGDVQAIKAVFERIEGKPGDDGAPAASPDIAIVHTFKSSI